MNETMLKVYIKIQNLMAREEGQDLVEYALVTALIALGATVTMKGLGTEISAAFTAVTTQLTTAVS